MTNRFATRFAHRSSNRRDTDKNLPPTTNNEKEMVSRMGKLVPFAAFALFFENHKFSATITDFSERRLGPCNEQ